MQNFQRPRPTGFRLEVTLLDTGLTIQRTVEVPSRLRVNQLHKVVQLAMGWQDYHLYEFRWGPYAISDDPDREVYTDDDPAYVLDATKVTVARLGLSRDSLFTYIYDFGDHWVHGVRVTDELYQPVERPRVVAGEGACPPEDVGGIGGYARFLEAWSDPEHEEHDDTVLWATGWYAPAPFDVAAADARVAKRFPGRRGQVTYPAP